MANSHLGSTAAAEGAATIAAIARADTSLQRLLAGVGPSHGIAHARDVRGIAARALAARPQRLPQPKELRVQLAALLHDADDHKYFPDNSQNQNARAVLAELVLEGVALGPDDVEHIVRMIGWVSVSKNGDAVPPGAEDWELYPRYADRLAASGWGGAYRCWHYTEEKGAPLYTDATPRAADEGDLWARVATRARYEAYRGASASMIDHYYDKLLRVLDQVKAQEPENEYLRKEAAARTAPLIEIALEFGRTGQVSVITLHRMLVEAEAAGCAV